MQILETKLKNVLLIKPRVFEDFRGIHVETYNEKEYTEAIKEKIGQEVKFVQDNISVSSKNVLRGIHGDPNTWKLVSCPSGKFYLVVVNPATKKWESFILSEKNYQQVLVPPKYGNGHLILSEEAIFHYKQSTYYGGAEKQFTIKFNDPKFNIWWPIKNPILSQRDESQIYL